MKFSTGLVTTAIMTIILITVLFSAYAEIVPEAQDSSDDMTDEGRCESVGCLYNATNTAATHNCQVNTTNTSECLDDIDSEYMPLQGLFSASGVLFIIVMAALVIIVIRSSLSSK